MFEDWNWGEILRSVVKNAPAAISTIYGARQVAKANRAAADLAGQTQQANLAAIREANERAMGMVSPLASAGTPGIEYLQGVMAGGSPYELTPAQRIELEDRRRAAVGMIPATMRGAGRFRTAAINDVLNRARAQMIQENMARQDRAASQLANIGSGAIGGMARLAASYGPDVASQNTAAAEALANAITGTAASNAATIGQIGSFFANEMRDRELERRRREYGYGRI